MWVLDHQDDIDADFLAIYGIDLEQVDVPARRYFALAYRLTAYQGVLTAVAEKERETTQPNGPSAATRTRNDAPPTRGGNETNEVPLTAFRFKFPGLVSMGGG